MYKKKVDVCLRWAFSPLLKKEKKKSLIYLERGKNKKKIKKDSRRKKNLDLIFHILHSLTSGSTWDNTLDQQSLKKTPNNNNNNII